MKNFGWISSQATLFAALAECFGAEDLYEICANDRFSHATKSRRPRFNNADEQRNSGWLILSQRLGGVERRRRYRFHRRTANSRAGKFICARKTSHSAQIGISAMWARASEDSSSRRRLRLIFLPMFRQERARQALTRAGNAGTAQWRGAVEQPFRELK